MRELLIEGGCILVLNLLTEVIMIDLALYEISPAYITYLSSYAPHLFLNKSVGQKNERKYIGIVFTVNGYDYFAPLSSFKEKHKK